MVDDAKLADARARGAIAAQIDGLTGIIAALDRMLAEKWQIKSLVGIAPTEGASLPAGTTVEALPFGPANDELSQLAWGTARAAYQKTLDDLTAQLATL